MTVAGASSGVRVPATALSMDPDSEMYDTVGFETDFEFPSADALAEELEGLGPRREEPEFGLTTGAFRDDRSGRFVDGKPPTNYDGGADRFREAPSGRFEPAPEPVPRRYGFSLFPDSLFGGEP